MEILLIILILAGLSALVIIHEFGHFLVAKRFGLLIEEFGFGLPPRFWSRKIGETLYSFNWLPFGGFVRIFGEHPETSRQFPESQRAFFRQPVWKRAAIVGAGVAMNFLLGWLLLSLVFGIGIPRGLLVTGVQVGGIADRVGLQKNDFLLDFAAVPDLVSFLDKNKGTEVILRVRRNSEIIFFKLVPRKEVPAGEGNIGIYVAETGSPKLGFGESIWRGLQSSLAISAAVIRGLWDLTVGIFTRFAIGGRFIGPVGIVNMAIETAKLGLVSFLQLLATISLNVAVFNLLPVPALDGGRLLFLIIEKLRGRPINFKTEIVINSAGFAFLLFLILAVTAQDLFRLF